MTLQFNTIPGNARVPLFWAEVNPAQTPYQSNSRLLLIGQYDDTNGNAVEAEAYHIVNDIADRFGAKSMLADTYKYTRLNTTFQEVWAAGLKDDAASVKATGSIQVDAAALAALTNTSSISVYISGHRIRSVVYTTDTADALAARLQSVIDLDSEALVSSSINGGDATIIDIEAIHGGAQGNTIRIETNLTGEETSLVDSLLTITQMSGGAADPEIDAVLDLLGDEEFDWIAFPYADATNLSHMETFLNGSTGRWSPFQQLYGHGITAKNDTVANLGTFGNSLNDPHVSIMGVYNSPSPTWQWVGAMGGVIAEHLTNAPELSRPLQTLNLEGIWAPKAIQDRPNRTSRQSLYYDGISSYHVERDGTVSIDRMITTYQLNEWGSPDASWLDVNTLAQNMYAVRYIRAKITGIWGRASLRDENPRGIQGVATPDDLRNTMIHAARELSNLNVIENEDQFADAVIVARNATDANRVDVYAPFDQVNQLRIFAMNYTSFLQYYSNQGV